MGLVGDLWGGYGADSRSMGLGMGYGAAEGRSMGQKMCGAAPSLCGKGGTEGRDNWGWGAGGEGKGGIYGAQCGAGRAVWGAPWGGLTPIPAAPPAAAPRRGKHRSLSPAPRRPAGRCGAAPWGSAVGQSRGVEPWGTKPRPLPPLLPPSPLISSLCSSPGAGPRPLSPQTTPLFPLSHAPFLIKPRPFLHRPHLISPQATPIPPQATPSSP